ncbi:uncharacterized protein PG998_015196 [Apiospora kogelbergensis]|uniref:uncharacterized protein n=1 Tax=Apiospora kogelbergensis TaxID=1337665 RepID=UPI0031324FAF
MDKPAPKLQQVQASAGRDAILRALREDGAVIIKGLFTTDQVRRLNEEVQPSVDQLHVGSKHTEEWVKDFHGDNTKRLNNVVSLSPTFRHEVLESDLIHQCCEAIYLEDAGGYWMNSAQVIDIGPGSRAQPLHRDQWQFPIFTHAGPDAPEASINFVVALSDFTGANGATRMEPGDACFISGKVVHGGGANITDNATRRAITLVFQCSYLTPEEAYPFNVEKDIARSLSPRGQRMIGFRSQFLKNSPGVWKRDYGEPDEVYC